MIVNIHRKDVEEVLLPLLKAHKSGGQKELTPPLQRIVRVLESALAKAKKLS